MNWIKANIETLKVGAFAIAGTMAMMLAAACASKETLYQPACPNMPAYSAENQKATAAELRDAAAKGLYPLLREKTVDGGNLRSQLRGAGCKEAANASGDKHRPQP